MTDEQRLEQIRQIEMLHSEEIIRMQTQLDAAVRREEAAGEALLNVSAQLDTARQQISDYGELQNENHSLRLQLERFDEDNRAARQQLETVSGQLDTWAEHVRVAERELEAARQQLAAWKREEEYWNTDMAKLRGDLAAAERREERLRKALESAIGHCNGWRHFQNDKTAVPYLPKYLEMEMRAALADGARDLSWTRNERPLEAQCACWAGEGCDCPAENGGAQEPTQIILSPADQKLLVDTLENPPEPTRALRDAFKRGAQEPT